MASRDEIIQLIANAIFQARQTQPPPAPGVTNENIYTSSEDSSLMAAAVMDAFESKGLVLVPKDHVKDDFK